MVDVEKFEFLPNLPTSVLIEQGEQVTLKAHIKDVLMHYDIVQAPVTLLDGIEIPETGRFFKINPIDQEQWWTQKLQ